MSLLLTSLMQPDGPGIGGRPLFDGVRTRCCLELNRIDPTEIIADPNWTATGSPYLRKNHHAMDNQVMATNATETITRLNLRIRLSYACAQLSCWSLSDVRFAVPTNPLAFTDQNFKPDEMESQAEIFPKRKTNLWALM
jgi:hypothetical protein